VDPWGSERLLEHLNRMWYGGRAVEQQQEQEQQQQRRQHRERGHSTSDHQRGSNGHSEEREVVRDQLRRSLRDREWEYEQRTEDIFNAFSAAPQDATTQQVEVTQPWSPKLYRGCAAVC